MNINSIVWFLKRPVLLPQAFRIFLRRFFQNKEQTRNESESWCRKQAINTKTGISLLFPDHRFIDFFEYKSELLRQAHIEEKKCELSMGGAGDLNLLYNICLVLKPEKVLETGVAFGWSALAILSALCDNDNGKLISTDMPYMHINNEPYVGCVVPENLKKKWQLIKEADITGLPKAIKFFQKEIDLCHYDSDKSYVGRIWAYPRLWNALKKGGVFVSDDIGDNIAFKEFCESNKVAPQIIEYNGKYIGLIKK